MVNSSEFGERLQKILDYYRLSATELSNQISFNRSTISHLLSGRNKPSLDFVMKVLQKYPEVELYWLLNGKGTFPATKNEIAHDNVSNEKGIEKKPFIKKEGDQMANTPTMQNKLDSEEIEHIIIFYKDGSYKSFKN